MSTRPLQVIVLGLTLSSSWGNGHATTYRALLKAFAARGHSVLFLESDKPWYASNRDLRDPDYCRLAFYTDLRSLDAYRGEIARADAVLVGSFVPDGIAVGRYVQAVARGVKAFYDIDTPVTLAALEDGECGYLNAELASGYDLYLSFTGGPTLQRLVREYGVPLARALPCSVDPEAYAPAGSLRRWDLSYLGTYAPDRQLALDLLLIQAARAAPQLRFVVAGPQYPEGIVWPRNVERIGHVPPSEHPAFFGSSRFTLNLTRAEMLRAGYSPSVRLFEAAACGTAIISDVWDGIESYFTPGREIALARSTDDVLAALTTWPAARVRALGRAARSRVLADHRAEHRAAALEVAIRDAFAARSGRRFLGLSGLARRGGLASPVRATS